MNNVKTARLIFGNDYVKQQDEVRQILAARGITVDDKRMPLSQIGTPDNLFARYMFYVDDAHCIVLAAHDVTIANRNDGGSTTEFCGFEWLIARTGAIDYEFNNYLADAHQAYNKCRAQNAFLAHLIESGKDTVSAGLVFETYLDLCATDHLAWKALFKQEQTDDQNAISA